MENLKRNRCPRCGGGLFVDSDMDGWYEQCINCSYRHELKKSVGLPKAAALKSVPYQR